jgi:hypothetical protein
MLEALKKEKENIAREKRTKQLNLKDAKRNIKIEKKES